MRVFLTTLILLVALAKSAGATFTDHFSVAPSAWQTWNPGAVVWDEQAQDVAVTWDSRRTNSFFFHKLPFTLTRADAFAVEFTLRLDDVQVRIDPNKNATFELAVGFLNMAQATRTNYFRGAGVNAATGPRSVVEFAYFPADSLIDATIAPIIASTNNQIAFSHTHPVELTPGETYRVRMAFDPAAQVLSTTILHNGEPYGEAPDNTIRPLSYTSNFGDFRIDAFSIHSYSDAGQFPQFAGSILAHGIVDDVVITTPEPPIANISIARTATAAVVRFVGVAGWTYTLERTSDFETWSGVTSQRGVNGAMELTDEAASDEAFYRVRAERL